MSTLKHSKSHQIQFKTHSSIFSDQARIDGCTKGILSLCLQVKYQNKIFTAIREVQFIFSKRHHIKWHGEHETSNTSL